MFYDCLFETRKDITDRIKEVFYLQGRKLCSKINLPGRFLMNVGKLKEKEFCERNGN